MTNAVQGFNVTVTVADAKPHVQVSLANGKSVVDTDALSIQGMERMGDVFACAARMAYDELDRYWQAEHHKLRDSRQTAEV